MNNKLIIVNFAPKKAQTVFFGNVLLDRVDTPTENAQSHARFWVCTRSTAKFSFYFGLWTVTRPAVLPGGHVVGRALFALGVLLEE